MKEGDTRERRKIRDRGKGGKGEKGKWRRIRDTVGGTETDRNREGIKKGRNKKNREEIKEKTRQNKHIFEKDDEEI